MSWQKKKSVLVPIDFSDFSYQAIAPAKEYVETIASLTLLHVLAPLHPADPAALWGTVKDEERIKKVQDFMHKKLQEMGYESIQTEVVIGDPLTEIVDYARETNVDLIVMTTHEQKDIGRFLLGSTAEQVVRSSHCSVLVIK